MRSNLRGGRPRAANRRAFDWTQPLTHSLADRLSSLGTRHWIHGLVFGLGLSVAIIGWAQPRPAGQMFEALVAVADQVGDALEDLSLVASEPADDATEPRTHVVEPGETLRQLAASYDVSVATIAWSNKLDDPDKIMPGQTLVIPYGNTVVHSVAPGETLRQVASRYAADPDAVARANNVTESEALDRPVDGGHLVVPDPQLPQQTTQTAIAARPAGRMSTGSTTSARRDDDGVRALGEINTLDEPSELASQADRRAAPAPRSPVVYEVQSGDSLMSLAAQFGVTVPTLLRANNLADPDMVVVGTKLRVLPVSGTEHEIKQGESVADLAAYYEVDMGPIVDFNGLLDPDVVRVGQTIIIPGAAKGPRPLAPAVPVPSVAKPTAPAPAQPAARTNTSPGSAQAKPTTAQPAGRSQTAAPAPAPAAVVSAPAAVAPAVTGGGGAGLLKNAMGYLGSRYVFGGTGPGGFDCSGFVWYVHKISGKSISRGLWGQLNGGPRVSRENLSPGDTVFFANTYMPGLSHVGIYIGGGRFIHASDERTGVTISSLGDSYWAPRYIGASRLY